MIGVNISIEHCTRRLEVVESSEMAGSEIFICIDLCTGKVPKLRDVFL